MRPDAGDNPKSGRTVRTELGRTGRTETRHVKTDITGRIEINETETKTVRTPNDARTDIEPPA